MRRLLFDPIGARLIRFTRAQSTEGPTPDFEVRIDDDVIAFCELKSPRDDWLENELDAAEPGEFAGGARPDPTFNRISRRFAKAVSQFDRVNSGRTVPNILVFVNHAAASHFGDLVETLTGNFHTSDGQTIPTMRHISEQRLGNCRQKVDVCIWVDGNSQRIQGFFFGPDHAHRTKLCELFKLDQAAISNA